MTTMSTSSSATSVTDSGYMWLSYTHIISSMTAVLKMCWYISGIKSVSHTKQWQQMVSIILSSYVRSEILSPTEALIDMEWNG